MARFLSYLSIRNLFLLSAAGGLVFLAVSVWFLADGYYRATKIARIQSVVSDITTDGFRLALFTHDTLASDYERAMQQWHAAHHNLRDLLVKNEELINSYRRQVELINSSLEAMLPTMASLVKHRRESEQAPEHDNRAHDLIIAQVAIRNAELQSAMTELENVVSRDVRSLLGVAWGSIFSRLIMIIILGALGAALVWFLFYQRVLNPVSVLVAGINRLKKGERQYRPGKTADDELGEVVSAFNGLLDQRDLSESQLNKKSELIACIGRLREQFIREPDPIVMFDALLKDILTMTHSEYGFIGEVLKDENDAPYMKAWAFSNVAWDDETRRFYEENKATGFVFTKLDNLFGRVITHSEVVISNSPAHDERRAGTPPGHPELKAFLGIPVYYGGKLIGEIGLANRPGGYDNDLVEFISPVVEACGQIISARWEREARLQAEKELLDYKESLEKIVDERTADMKTALRIAEKSNKAKSIFLANMSHELRTPMHAILSFSNLALKKVEDEKVIHYLENIVISGNRLTELLNDLLDLSKLEAGKMDVQFEKMDITQLIVATTEEVKSLLADKLIAMQINAAHHYECMLDRKLFTQVIMNLLSNAIKFSPENSTIRINVNSREIKLRGTPQNVVEIVIIDEGVGIPKEDLKLIF